MFSFAFFRSEIYLWSANDSTLPYYQKNKLKGFGTLFLSFQWHLRRKSTLPCSSFLTENVCSEFPPHSPQSLSPNNDLILLQQPFPPLLCCQVRKEAEFWPIFHIEGTSLETSRRINPRSHGGSVIINSLKYLTIFDTLHANLSLYGQQPYPGDIATYKEVEAKRG